MRRLLAISFLVALVVLAVGVIGTVSAQGPGDDLVLFTQYPSQVVERGKTISFKLNLRTQENAQTVRLEMKDIPEGWTATFRGGGNVIKAVYVQPDEDARVDLRLEPPADVESGTYRFVVAARGENSRVELPLELTMEEKLPARLSLSTELPTLKGSPTTTFRYSVKLANEGDEPLDVALLADAPAPFLVTFKLSGKEVTSLPLEANESKNLSVEIKSLASNLAANAYPITIRAQGGDTEASLQLTAEVTGQPDLAVTAPNGRLSGEAIAGKESPLQVIIRNTGTAPAYNVELNATEPSGWSVEFDPKVIAEVPVGEEVEVTAKIRPAEKAIAGDYMVTIRANPAEGGSESADFRITVRTSTLWGVVGIALIAVAVAVVAAAVLRFGRR
ncbi:MAG: hypothetical protein GXP42_05465 [Chloroflexi bacterium]|nr:hypothetical protein [Chloroflexota bacterium]